MTRDVDDVAFDMLCDYVSLFFVENFHGLTKFYERQMVILRFAY